MGHPRTLTMQNPHPFFTPQLTVIFSNLMNTTRWKSTVSMKEARIQKTVKTRMSLKLSKSRRRWEFGARDEEGRARRDPRNAVQMYLPSPDGSPHVMTMIPYRTMMPTFKDTKHPWENWCPESATSQEVMPSRRRRWTHGFALALKRGR